MFGELYGGAIESRFTRDLPEVVAWALGGDKPPQTVDECNFVADRLRTLQSRLSAAYKGLHALIIQRGGARDWRTGAEVEEQSYFDESIDIHHVFPRAWCDKRGNHTQALQLDRQQDRAFGEHQPQRWPASSRQRFASAKWSPLPVGFILCRCRGAHAGRA